MDKPAYNPPPVLNFLESPLHPISTEQFIQSVTALAAESSGDTEPLCISYLNAHCSNLAARDLEYRRVLESCGLVYADGQAVVWASGFLGAALPERVNAGDFILEFCRVATEKDLKIYLLGSAKGVAEAAAKSWCEAVPGLQVVGSRDGYFSKEEEAALVGEIRQARPDILLLGMGAPRQELWMQRWAKELGVPVLWCVGALFEYYGGQRSRAPRWLRRIGLEWLFRFALEPRRLAGRYLLGNLRFLWRVLKGR